ncbi:MAG: hypothetical protein KJ626_00140 [Verrucomicrobia bacterium]|nr:hypothetical protein [Verrucomicrobiota bacterium]
MRRLVTVGVFSLLLLQGCDSFAGMVRPNLEDPTGGYYNWIGSVRPSQSRFKLLFVEGETVYVDWEKRGLGKIAVSSLKKDYRSFVRKYRTTLSEDRINAIKQQVLLKEIRDDLEDIKWQQRMSD